MPRIAIAQLRPVKGEYAANREGLGGVLARVAELDPPVELLITPEASTSGYFVEGGVRDVAVTAGTLFRDLATRHEAVGGAKRPIDVAVGFYEVFQNRFYNSCLYATLGGPDAGVKHVHRKVFLPTYGVFDEERFVERGHEVRAFDTRFGRAAILICEDAWHSLTATIAALDGAQLLILPSASPARGTGKTEGEGESLPASVVRWERIVRNIAEEHGVFVAYASLVGFEGGKGFPGGSVVVRRGFKKGIVGLSGGVDSSLTAFLAAEALGRENVIGLRMPYRSSSPESMEHAQLVIDKLGIEPVTVDISAAVDGYFAQVGDDDPHRKGNVMARQRMIVLFDLSAKYRALPLGTGNKSERLLGYFTWHADDSPPVNPLGDLFKTQVWALARHVGVPEVIVTKPATADLIHGQTDEGDFGISYPKADRILYYLIRGMRPEEIVARGFTAAEVELVRGRLDSTHWKRRLPTVAVMSQTAIGEFYLRPVDY